MVGVFRGVTGTLVDSYISPFELRIVEDLVVLPDVAKDAGHVVDLERQPNAPVDAYFPGVLSGSHFLEVAAGGQGRGIRQLPERPVDLFPKGPVESAVRPPEAAQRRQPRYPEDHFRTGVSGRR